MEFVHKSVLLTQTVDGLGIKPGGIYVDCTAGGGGHSLEAAKRMDDSNRLICFDQDKEAIAAATKRLEGYNPIFINRNFCTIRESLREIGIEHIDGAMLDLGVSSYQLDNAERGFSFHNDAELDMRMSKSGYSAYNAVNELSERELSDIIFSYGEEKYARSIAKNIVKYRQDKPIETTLELCDIISASMPAKAKRDGHPARKTFQAIRIYINRELEMLPGALKDMFESLKPGGVLAIITFHSLEDRIVKNTFNEFCKGCTCPPDFPVCVCGKKPKGKLPFKSIAPSDSEVSENPRSRSARLRAVIKL